MTEEELSLADFAFPDGDDPLVPPSGFSEWLDTNDWAMSLMEPQLLTSVGPRGTVRRGGADADVVNMSSYNYLGLATHPEVLEAAHKALEKYGTGGCGSPLLSGLTDVHRELETAISTWLGREDTMLFNSGFGGGVSTLAGLLRKGDAAIMDGKCHLCLMDGAKLSKAKMAFFEHNNAESLDEVLTKFEGRRRLVVLEGVYSMDGDYAKLDELLPVVEKHGVGVMIDEAHSIGVYGEKGRGVTDKFGANDKIALQYATFSKSFAHVGGFVSGSRELLRYLRYYANGYGFSCTLPPVVVAGILKGLEVSTRDESLREKLWANVAYFREQCGVLGLNTGESTSQVVPVIVGADRRALFEMTAEMNRKGLFLAPVDYPSVPMDGLRYRVAVTAAHERADLDQALSILEDVVVRRLKSA